MQATLRLKENERETERERAEERQRDADTEKFGACSTSLSGGNQVGGLPPVVHLHSAAFRYYFSRDEVLLYVQRAVNRQPGVRPKDS